MARIELRHATIHLKDGLAGTSAVMTTAPMASDTTVTIDSTATDLNTTTPDLIPLGANFTIAGETDVTTVHTVTARTPASMGPTTSITFSPALGPGTYTMTAALTFQSQDLSIKIGDGDIKYTENAQFNYDLDRGLLDTVREGDEQPMDITLSFVYEHITQGTGEPVSPMDALKGIGGAAEWVTSATDKCEPYAVDLVVEHVPPCGTAEKETTTFPDFRSEKREISYKDALITITGKSNAVEPIVARG